MKKTIITMAMAIVLSMASMATAKDLYTTQYGFYFTASTKSDMKKVVNFMSVGDIDALAKLAVEGRIVELKEGLEVYVVSRSLGLVEIRPKGVVDTCWTVMEAVK
jgi:hypothetical protein